MFTTDDIKRAHGIVKKAMTFSAPIAAPAGKMLSAVSRPLGGMSQPAAPAPNFSTNAIPISRRWTPTPQATNAPIARRWGSTPLMSTPLMTKTQTARSAFPIPSRSLTAPVGTLLDPATAESLMQSNRVNIVNKMFNPQLPGVGSSIGKSLLGTALKTPVIGPGINLARSFVGLSPERSGFRNMMSGYPMILGGKVLGFPAWEQAGRQNLATMGSQMWKAPMMRAERQSGEWQQALPQLLRRKGYPGTVPELWKWIEQAGLDIGGSKFPAP